MTLFHAPDMTWSGCVSSITATLPHSTSQAVIEDARFSPQRRAP